MAVFVNGPGAGNINYGHNNTYLAPTAISLSIWLFPIAPPGLFGAILDRVSLASTAYYQILYKSTGKMAYYTFASANVSIDPGSHTLTLSTWNHIGLAYDSVNGLATYVNGASDGTAAANGTLATSFLVANLYTGFDPNTAGRTLNGNVADAALWNTNLTAFEFAALAKGVRPGRIRPNALQMWVPLDGLQSPEPDLAGGANNGTLTSTSFAFGPPIAPFTSRWPQFGVATAQVAADMSSLGAMISA